MAWDYEGKTPIKIDFNIDTFNSLEMKLVEEGKNPFDYEVVLTNAQFQTFKLMYKWNVEKWDETGIIRKNEIIEPTTMGSVYGISYHVEG